ncbi:HAD family hydrolase [Propionicicella superfundia]|uniref:HAD family hydrolase n=1 Tax=Propionicicella superfundia TaxID=348582 RepID=UPI00068585E5|nr:HAD family phosphatase [Propionicicella superfundia]
MTREPAAVVFDLDGVLVDTEPAWDAVRRGLAAADGVPWPPGATQAMMGLNTQEWSAYLADVVGLRGDAASAAARTIAGLRSVYRTDLTAKPDAVAAIRRMGALAPLGIASSSPRILIETVVDVLGVTDLFSVVVSTEEVGVGKPAPDGYLEACRRLGADPAASIAVEDSGSGIRAAAAAGMLVVAVPDSFTRAAPATLTLAHAVLDSLADLDAELAIDLMSRRFPGQPDGLSSSPDTPDARI